MNNAARINSRLRSSFSTTSKPSLKPVAPANTTQSQLDILNQVLAEVESMASVAPQATLAATDTLNPTQPITTTLKEAAAASLDISPIESGAGLQQIEYEQSGELPVEVESYLQKVEETQAQNLGEVVIADGTTTPSIAHPPVKKPVIILPITATEEKAGQKKPLHSSIRWLVEWSKKIMKMFTGEVIYKQEPTT